MNNWKEKILSIVLILSSLILDGFVANYWSQALDTNYGLMIPRTIFLVFIILSFHYTKNFMLTNAVIFGFLMDTYFLGFIGIYLTALLAIVLMIFKFKEVVHGNVMSYTLLTIVIITMIEFFIYGVIRVLGISGMNIQEFLVSRLAATLFLNTIVMLLSSYFIERLILHSMNKN